MQDQISTLLARAFKQAAPWGNPSQSISDEQLLADCVVDEDGFVGMDLALIISAEDSQSRAQAAQALQASLAAQGLQNVDVPPDGACQFHALVLAAGLDEDADALRARIVQYLHAQED